MKKSFLGFLALGMLAYGCGSDGNGNNNVVLAPTASQTSSQSFTTTTNSNGSVTTVTSVVTATPANPMIQVEQLARPAVAEGLLLSQSNFRIYNSVGPAVIAAALSNPNGPEAAAAAPVLTEATTVLNLLDDPSAGLTTAQKVGAFLPDVMRIDSTIDLAATAAARPAVSAYAAVQNAVKSPVAGRKLTDDTIDITLTVLSDSRITTDNVPYYPVAGNDKVGHHNLNQQAAPNGPAQFPFLAPAN